jgi:copper chaperone CopZ
VAVFAIGLAAFPYYSASVQGSIGSRARVNGNSAVPGDETETVQFTIAGMTCAGCASGLQATLKRAACVSAARVDYPSGQATISYDPHRQSPESLATVISELGYRIERKQN